MLVFHQPNHSPDERPHLFNVEEKGDELVISPCTL